MATRETTVTRKGQVTIPIEIRRALALHEGDRLAVERQGKAVVLRRSGGVAERTAGMLAHYARADPPTPDTERAAF